MKKISIYIVSFVMILGFFSCQENDDLQFIVQPDPNGISFTNAFLSEYVITPATSGNIAERFVWNKPSFPGTPTAITYELQVSLTQDFATREILGTTSETNIAVTVQTLLTQAANAGLDNDPNTPALNKGVVYFRIRAYAGNGGTDAPQVISSAKSMNLTLPEIVIGSGVQISTWGIVGSGFNNWGNGGPDAPFYTTAQKDVFVAYVTLLTGEIKFRQNNDWAVNLGDTGADGTLDANGDNIVSTAGKYKVTLDIAKNSYTIEPYSLGIVGSGFNNWGNNGPDAEFHYDYTTDTFKAGVQLLTGDIKFRLNNDWGTNYGDTGADGTLDAGGDNIKSTAGHYQITIDFNKNTYKIEQKDVYGIVGSGYNNWGNGGPDFSFTEYNPGLFIANNVTLLTGEIKFRLNNDWGTNYGDTGADGTLEVNGDNIASTAGKYQVILDFTDTASPKYTIKAL